MCISPMLIKNKKINHLSKANEQTTQVPCGKCAECKIAKIRDWRFRLSKELQRCSSSYFVTLTYDEENVPLSEWGEKTLKKKDLQDFFKRLRIKESGNKKSIIKYYAVGEYGSQTKRPHYHAIIMNVDNPINIQEAWAKGFSYSPELDQEGNGVGYVLKYISKDKEDALMGREPEFSLMSKGIGSNYLTKAIKKYHTQSVELCYITGKNGEKLPMPKYYKEKIYSEEMRAQVTKYLAKRNDEKATLSEENEILKSKVYSREEVLRNRDIRKSGIVIEERKEKL